MTTSPPPGIRTTASRSGRRSVGARSVWRMSWAKASRWADTPGSSDTNCGMAKRSTGSSSSSIRRTRPWTRAGPKVLNLSRSNAEDAGMARILVVDDEPAIARIIRLLLEPEGHEVLVANDGSRGFAMAQRQDPDLIVLDLMMPVMDGIWLLGML